MMVDIEHVVESEYYLVTSETKYFCPRCRERVPLDDLVWVFRQGYLVTCVPCKIVLTLEGD